MVIVLRPLLILFPFTSLSYWRYMCGCTRVMAILIMDGGRPIINRSTIIEEKKIFF